MIKGALIFAVGGAIGFVTGWVNGAFTGMEMKTSKELANKIVASEMAKASETAATA